MSSIPRYIIVILSIIIFGAIIYYLSDIVAYILIAWVLSILGRPLMIFYKKKLAIKRFRFGDSFYAILTLLTFVFVTLLMISIFVPLIVTQANNLSNVDYMAVSKVLEVPLGRINDWTHSIGLLQEGQSTTDQLHNSLVDWFAPAKVSNILSSIIAAFGNIAVGITSIFFIAFFFLTDTSLFLQSLLAFAPKHHEQNVRHAVHDISKMITAYLRGILLQMLFVATFLSVILFTLGIKNALLIGIFGALMNVVPYIGPIIGVIFGTIITVSSNLDLDFYNGILPQIIKVMVVFGVMQLTDNFIVQPMILSNSVKAHPLEIFIVTMIGAKMGGITGMVLAVPLYTVFRVIARSFLSEFKVIQQLTESLDE